MSGRRRGLTPEDERLWRSVTSEVKPLAPSSPRHVSPEPDAKSDPPPVERKAAEKPARKHNAHRPAPPPKPAATPLAPIDRRSRVRISRGHDTIDARIDLHGMRQDEAHRQLRAFLHRAQAKGAKTVLVITGKGKSVSDEGPWWEKRESGVLKASVPKWLGQPDLRPLVVGFDWASRSHGGEGALYIRLRKTKPPKGYP